MLTFTSDQWVIVALVFVLGLLVGGFLFSGGGRKWKQRYNAEVVRRRELETEHGQREKEWREQDSLRAAALKDRDRAAVVAPVVTDRHDLDRDGVVDSDETTRADRPAGFMDRVLGRDADRDGDGVDDRVERDRPLRDDRPL